MKELVETVILDCRVRNHTQRTVYNYEKQLSYFVCFLEEKQEGKKQSTS